MTAPVPAPVPPAPVPAPGAPAPLPAPQAASAVEPAPGGEDALIVAQNANARYSIVEEPEGGTEESEASAVAAPAAPVAPVAPLPVAG